MQIKDYLDRFEILFPNNDKVKDYRRAYTDKDLSSIFRLVNNEDLRKSVMEENLYSIFRLVKGSPLTFLEGDNNLRYLEGLAISSSINFNSWTGSSSSQFAGTASLALTASYALNAGTTINTGSFATTGSNTFRGGQTISGSLDVSGSGRFTNGLTVTGSLAAPNITGSLQGTASWAVSASWAPSSTLSTSFISTGSVSASVSTNTSSLFEVVSGSTSYFKIANNNGTPEWQSTGSVNIRSNGGSIRLATSTSSDKIIFANNNVDYWEISNINGNLNPLFNKNYYNKGVSNG
jgi:hypothetical protein